MAIGKASMLGAALALAMVAPRAMAQTVIEQAMEHRFQLDFHVPDAALQKMLPAGWEPFIATQGPAKDCNLRMIFIDRMAIAGADGKAKGSERLVYLAIPVKQAGSTMQAGQMIIAGLTDDAAAAPGAFGTYQRATTAKMARNVGSSGGAPTSVEDWEFTAANGEHMSLHVAYERAPANKGAGEVKFFNPGDPSKYQIFKTEQAIDILRNATTNPPDRVKEFSYRAGGGRLATLFDGTEKVVSWDSFPWYNRTVMAP